MTEPDRDVAEGSRRGLAYILGATAVAGIIGYIIQAVVPAFTQPVDYIAFSVFWSVVYLMVSALSGIQQEVTRSAHPRTDRDAPGWTSLARFTIVAAAIALVIVLASAPFWAPVVFATAVVPLTAALAVAAVGYTFVAALSGGLYGVRNWPGVATMTVTDSVLRLATVALVLAVGGGLAALGWAIAVPFVVAFLVVWMLSGRRVRSGLQLDATPARLAGNSVSTVIASAATGIMISGLPFLLGLTAADADATLLASLILVITLTRAPLVIPLLALQSLLVVTFRDERDRMMQRVVLWGGALLALTAVLAALAVVVGPWVIALLYGDRYEVPGFAYAAIVASAGLTGVLCITGPAALAAGRHGIYLAGWLVASGSLIIGLVLPLGHLTAVLTAIVVAPILGVGVHLVGLTVPARGGAIGADDA
jgi:O-antigen/teichoic acid export membrane protein